MATSVGRVSDLVRDSELRTTTSPGLTHHTYYVSKPGARRQQIKETWRRHHQLGNGTFGCVWLEQCETTSSQCGLRAVKELKKGVDSSYEREIEALAKFSHDNYVHCFVKFFGWFETEGVLSIAMEYLEHGDLQNYLQAPFPETEAKQIAAQLAEGLDFLHKNDFAHRDLKPPNVLVAQPRPSWWVKISDFGISKRTGLDTALRTHIGTPGYIAPEVIGMLPLSEMHGNPERHEKTYNSSVDMWALGAIVVQMLTQTTLFPTPNDLFKYVVHELPLPRQVLESRQIGDDCYDFLGKTMAPSPSSRLTASEALVHPWLKMSRPPSVIGSEHENSITPDNSSFAKQPTVLNHTESNGVMTEASLAWSTLSTPNTTMSPSTTELEPSKEHTQPLQDIIDFENLQNPKIPSPEPELESEKQDDVDEYAGLSNKQKKKLMKAKALAEVVQLESSKEPEAAPVPDTSALKNTSTMLLSSEPPQFQRQLDDPTLVAQDMQQMMIKDDISQSASQKSWPAHTQADKGTDKEINDSRFNPEPLREKESSNFDQGLESEYTVKKYDSANLDGEPATGPDVLARLTFTGIEDLRADILAIARRIYHDEETLKLSYAARELGNKRDKDKIQSRINNIGPMTTWDSIKSAIANGGLPTKEALHSALESENNNCLIALLQCLADPNIVVDEATYAFPHLVTKLATALTFAVSRGNEVGVWALVSAGAQVNPCEDLPTYSKPLVEAVAIGHVNIFRFLLANGADPNLGSYGYKRFPGYKSPMNLALMGHPPTVKSVNATKILVGQDTSLKLARLLLNYGAKLDEKSLFRRGRDDPKLNAGNNAFHLAAWWGYAETLTWLAKNIPAMNPDWYPLAVYCAALQGHGECLDVLTKEPYKTTVNLHYLINGYMQQESPHSDYLDTTKRLSWASFARAMKKLISTGHDPHEKVVFNYKKRGLLFSQARDVSEPISAVGLLANMDRSVGDFMKRREATLLIFTNNKQSLFKPIYRRSMMGS